MLKNSVESKKDNQRRETKGTKTGEEATKGVREEAKAGAETTKTDAEKSPF